MSAAAPDFADARRLVRDHLLDHWKAEDGRLYVAENGFESPTQWRVLAGSYENLVDHDPEYAVEPGVAYLVDKASGQVQTVHLIPANLAELDAMLPYGIPEA